MSTIQYHYYGAVRGTHLMCMQIQMQIANANCNQTSFAALHDYLCNLLVDVDNKIRKKSDFFSSSSISIPNSFLLFQMIAHTAFKL